MKTAISVPDDLFQRAEKFAKQAKKSRSRLYADALGEYLHRHEPDRITAAWNKIAHLQESPEDRAWIEHATDSWKDLEWS